MSPLLSICIPTYNRAELLERCLEELRPELAHLPERTEILVSDSASTDRTPEIIADAFPGVTAIRHPARLEAIDNYFAAMRAAQGRYAVMLGDDDAIDGKALAAAVAEMEQRPDWVAAFSPYHETVIEPGGERIVGTACTVDEPFFFLRGDFDAAVTFFCGPRMYHPEMPLVRAEVFRQAVVRPRKMFYGYWLFASLLRAGDVGMLDQPTHRHRLRAATGPHPQMQWEFAVDRMDQCRLGYEYLIWCAMQQKGIASLDGDTQRRLAEFFVVRMASYAEVAARVAFQMDDPQAAMEILTRCALWGGLDLSGPDQETLPERVARETARWKATCDRPPPDLSDALRITRHAG